MQSIAATVEQYLAELPADRRAAIQQVREVILKNLDRGSDGKSGYAEGMSYGMIGYFIPHSIYPSGYHCDPKQPLPFAGLASQKNHMSLYIMPLYGDGPHWWDFKSAWARTGKKLDMGKCCIRFKKVEELALDVIGNAIGKTSVKSYIAFYENALKANEKAAAQRREARIAVAPAKKKSTAKKPTTKKAIKKTTKKSKTTRKK